jgi:hypothetical protein
MDQESFAPPSQLTPNIYIHKQEQKQESIQSRQVNKFYKKEVRKHPKFDSINKVWKPNFNP